MERIDNDGAQNRDPWINLAALRWAENRTDMRGLTKHLLLFLARRSDDYGCSWYRQASLAEGVGCSERAIRKHLGTLIAAGVLRKIGRCRGGGQISNVYHLTGWSGRTRLPAGGHPKLGKYIREEPLADLLHALNRHQNPAAAETSADQNKVIEKITATEAEKQAALERCLMTLGPWATEDNRRYLTRARETLFGLLGKGHDLDRHVIPAIRAMVLDDRAVPSLKSWAYFANAVGEYAASLRAGDHDDVLRPQRETSTPGNAPDSPVAAEGSSEAINPTMDRFLRQLMKPGHLRPIAGEE